MRSLNLIFQPWITEQFKSQTRTYEKYWNCNSTRVGQMILSIWFSFSFTLLKPEIAGIATWKLPLYLYPHINFTAPRLLDPVRFMIQTLWLVFFKQSPCKLFSKKVLAGASDALSWLKNAFYIPFSQISKLVLWLEKAADQTNSSEVRERMNESKLVMFVNYMLLFIVVFIALLCFTVPFGYQAQTVFILLLWALAMMVRRMPGRFPTMLLIILSVTASCRYLWWRYSSTLNWDDPIALILGSILLLAETYSWIVLLLGYFQNIWPLSRKPVSMPKDHSSWPTIDLMIPTYNEDLDVVKATVYASLGVDWPKDKLNIHILDDGKRDSFRDYC